jgi:AcrR family transcriptional regulator
MANRPTRPLLGARYDRRREAAVAGAARTFAERGYAETSVAELAEQLGLAAGALYHYFEGKEALLIAICDELTVPLLDPARELLDSDRGPAATLRELLRAWVGHVTTHRDHLRVFTQVRHVVDHGEEWRGVRRARKDFERLLDEALGRLARDGELAIDPGLARSALLGMVNHTAQWYRPRGRLTPEEIADGYAAAVLGSYGSSRPSQPS